MAEYSIGTGLPGLFLCIRLVDKQSTILLKTTDPIPEQIRPVKRPVRKQCIKSAKIKV